MNARLLGLLLTSALTLGCATVRPAAVTGPEWLKATGPLPSLEGRHVVFVAGFMNELIPGYFTDNVAVTEQLGGTSSVLFPPSGDSLARDVERIRSELAFRQGEKVVLVGHSKGGAAVLLTVLEHPELILSGKVSCVVALQGAIGGSPLADALHKVRPLRSPGLTSLTTGGAKAAFTTALRGVEALTAEQQEQLFSRIFYVRSAHQANAIAAELSVSELLLRGQGPNDGLVSSSNMKLGMGVDLGVLDADHAALTVSSFLSVSSQEERRAFTLALYRELDRRMNR
jgi:pimeloyl-ACP methyl ester carboxylesterase